jgi:hypothetical protein
MKFAADSEDLEYIRSAVRQIVRRDIKWHRKRPHERTLSRIKRGLAIMALVQAIKNAPEPNIDSAEI